MTMRARPRQRPLRSLSIVVIAASVLSTGADSIVRAQPAQPPPAQPTPPAATPATPAEAAPSKPTASTDPTRGDRMRAYHDAMLRRRLGSQEPIIDRLNERVAEAESLISTGRHDEAIAKLTEIVEHPKFDVTADSAESRAALYLLGHALASAGITLNLAPVMDLVDGDAAANAPIGHWDRQYGADADTIVQACDRGERYVWD